MATPSPPPHPLLYEVTHFDSLCVACFRLRSSLRRLLCAVHRMCVCVCSPDAIVRIWDMRSRRPFSWEPWCHNALSDASLKGPNPCKRPLMCAVSFTVRNLYVRFLAVMLLQPVDSVCQSNVANIWRVQSVNLGHAESDTSPLCSSPEAVETRCGPRMRCDVSECF